VEVITATSRRVPKEKPKTMKQYEPEIIPINEPLPPEYHEKEVIYEQIPIPRRNPQTYPDYKCCMS
jgi:hypothetical protein